MVTRVFGASVDVSRNEHVLFVYTDDEATANTVVDKVQTITRGLAATDVQHWSADAAAWLSHDASDTHQVAGVALPPPPPPPPPAPPPAVFRAAPATGGGSSRVGDVFIGGLGVLWGLGGTVLAIGCVAALVWGGTNSAHAHCLAHRFGSNDLLDSVACIVER